MIIYNLAFLLLLQFSESTTLIPGEPAVKKVKTTNVVFRSTDGGKTFQDISEGLPGDMEGGKFFASKEGLFVNVGDQLLNTTPSATAPFWKPQVSDSARSDGSVGSNAILSNNTNTQTSQKTAAKNITSPAFANLQSMGKNAPGGSDSVFVGNSTGLSTSMNSGNRKMIYKGGWVDKFVESNGVLLATAQAGIIRSSDGGETWDLVISEGGVGIAVEKIKGGFAAITFNGASQTRRMRTSYDGGKTWQPIDAGLKANLLISSIVEVGDEFFCGHPDGIFQSSDKGKTWKMLLPSVENKVFTILVSGKVIYAIARDGGC